MNTARQQNLRDGLLFNDTRYSCRGVCFNIVESSDDVSVGDGTFAFVVPSFLEDHSLVEVVAAVHTKGVSGSTDIQIRKRSRGSDLDMLSEKVSIGASEYFSVSEEAVKRYKRVSVGDLLYIDVDSVSSTAPKGLSVTLSFKREV